MAEQPPCRHVVLVGLMGSGKSTVGRRVANRLGRRFFDADDELEARTGRSVREWFDTYGEAAFRSAESRLLRELLSERVPSVIATGGGVVVDAANRKVLAGALVLWLDAPPAFLASRLVAKAQKQHRPLLDDDPAGTIERLHAERVDWYRSVADHVVSVAPVHASADSPKRALADIVVGLVRTAEAEAWT